MLEETGWKLLSKRAEKRDGSSILVNSAAGNKEKELDMTKIIGLSLASLIEMEKSYRESVRLAVEIGDKDDIAIAYAQHFQIKKALREVNSNR